MTSNNRTFPLQMGRKTHKNKMLVSYVGVPFRLMKIKKRKEKKKM
jgi:hypothetical protein